MPRYTSPGFCAIDPRAYGGEFPASGAPPQPKTEPGAAVISVAGPLCYTSSEFVTYDMLTIAVSCAIAVESAHTVALIIDSPGGDVPGAFDTARKIRAMIKGAGKRFLVHTSSAAASAAYALACCADEISVSSTGQLGSIGVITAITSNARAEKSLGIDYAIITSGPRKADGNSHLPLSQDAIDAYQSSVDVMAGEFFRLVDEHRGIDSRALGAAMFTGQAAVAAGLADVIESRDEFLARAGTIASLSIETTKLSTTAQAAVEHPFMAKASEDKKDDVRAALAAAAEDDSDKDKQAKAKRALAAFDKEDEDDDKEKAKATASAAASLASTVQSLTAAVEAQKLQITALNETLAAKAKADERAAFFATRPDLNEDVVKSFAKVDLETVKSIVASIPVGPSRVAAHASTPSVTPGEGAGAISVSPELKATAARLMGLDTVERVNESTPERLTLGRIVRKVS